MQNSSFAALATILISSSLVFQCKPKAPEKPKESEQLKIFLNAPEETLKPTRWDVGDTTMGNEDRLDLFYKDAQNLGGGYVGVGSLQNFLLAAWAKSEWVWMMDFTRIVVAANRIHLAFIKESATAEEYIKLWKKKSSKPAVAALEKHFANDPDYRFIKKSYRGAHYYVNRRITLDLMLSKKRKFPIWLNTPDQYAHIRQLATAGKIRAIRGDLSGKTTVQAIGKAATQMGITMRLIYTSNAEEYVAVCWPCNHQFMDNMLSLPVDQRSVVLRTVSSPNRRVFTWAPGSELTTKRGFHYNVMPAVLHHKWMSYRERPFKMPELISGGEIDKKNGFSRSTQSPPATTTNSSKKPAS